MSPTTILEATMLVCFGAAWPIASASMLRTRRAQGRGLLPTSLVLCGYLAGMLAKIICACDGGGLPTIFWMYLFNAASVTFNLWLQWRFAEDGLPTVRARLRPLPVPFGRSRLAAVSPGFGYRA